MTAPHGFVCLLPGAKPQTAGRWTSLWTTDGDTLSKDGKDYSLADARNAIARRSLPTARKRFPFRVEGQVFHQIIEQAPGRYVVVLVDPGWLNPAERDVTLAAQLPGNWRVTDRFTGEPLGDSRQPLTLPVPAGAFRLVEASR